MGTRTVEVDQIKFSETIFGNERSKLPKEVDGGFHRQLRKCHSSWSAAVGCKIKSVACGFKQGEKLNPGGTGLVWLCEVPSECGQEIVNLCELFAMLDMPMVAFGERTETEIAASASVTVRKLDGNLHFGHDSLAFAVGIGAESIGMLDLFIGENHGDDEFLELEHKFAVMELTLGIVLGDIMGIIAKELETVVGGTV